MTTRAGAPLVLLFAGFPLWWVLGAAALVPLVIGVFLAWRLAHQKSLHLPPGATLWALFLIWVCLGVFVLGVDAPGAAPGGDGFGRALVFGYRVGWYLTCTVFLLWLGNTTRRQVPDRLVHGLIALLFAITTVGGVLGILMPTLEFTSPVELLLPGGLRGNSFVASMVHPEVADIQSFLGRDEARPKAPFAFTNTWGSVMALSLVFAIAWAWGGRRRHRVLLAAGLMVAAVPVVFSLNRGLWVCIALGCVGAVALAVWRGHAGRMLVVASVVVAVTVLFAGPLIGQVSERLDNQHSNDRRGSLASATADSVTQGSPVVGFGTTRDVQGSFASISGGSTPDCPACGVPPLGTQGHFWLVLFSQGWIGVGLFVGFLLTSLRRSWRCRTPNETLATFVLAFFCVQIFIYDTLGMPLLLVMLAVALVWREQREEHRLGRAWTTPQLRERVARGAPLALSLALFGLVIGASSALASGPRPHTTELRLVLTTPPDPYSPEMIGDVLGEESLKNRDLRMTIDTEAALLLSESTLRNAVSQLHEPRPPSPSELRDSVRLSAEPNTQILVLRVNGPGAEESRERAVALASTYLEARQAYVDARRTDLLTRLNRDLREVLPTDPTTATLLLRLNAADRRLRSDAHSVGRVVNVEPSARVPRQIAMRTTTGAALGLLVGIGLGALARTRTQNRREKGTQR